MLSEKRRVISILVFFIERQIVLDVQQAQKLPLHLNQLTFEFDIFDGLKFHCSKLEVWRKGSPCMHSEL